MFALGGVWNGTNWDRLYGDKTNGAFVNIKSSITIPVSGTFWQATQPVSSTQLPAALDGSGYLKVHEQGTATVSVSNFPGTQPVSGTVTANQGTPNTAANSWPVEQTDGTNILGTSTHPVRVDPTGTTTQPVSGTVSVNPLPAGSNTIGKVDILGNAGAAVDAATGAAPPANAILHAGLGSGATGGDLVAMPICDSYDVVNISTATTTLEITGVSGRQVRICSLHLIAGGADNVAIIEGTGLPAEPDQRAWRAAQRRLPATTWRPMAVLLSALELERSCGRPRQGIQCAS